MSIEVQSRYIRNGRFLEARKKLLEGTRALKAQSRFGSDLDFTLDTLVRERRLELVISGREKLAQSLEEEIKSGPPLKPVYPFKPSLDEGPSFTYIRSWAESEVLRDINNGSIQPLDQAKRDLLFRFDDYVLFEDEHLLALNKPAGVLSHYGTTEMIGIEEIAKYVRGPRINLAHRLDHYTTGVLLLTKTPEAEADLDIQFADKTASSMRKIYLAILDGAFRPDESPVRVEVPIAPTNTLRMKLVMPGQTHPDAKVDQAKSSVTDFYPISVFHYGDNIYTLAQIQIFTGRTHQIRVVSADFLHHPVVGDRMYGRGMGYRYLLHALELEFNHPIKRNRMKVKAPVPDDFRSFLTRGGIRI